MKRVSTLLLAISIFLITGYVQPAHSDEIKGQLPAVSFHIAALQGRSTAH